MPTPEQRPETGSITPEKKLAQSVDELLARKTDEEGKEIKGSALVENRRLRLLAMKTKAPGANLEEISVGIADYLGGKLKLYEEGKLPEEDYDQIETQALLLQTVLVGEYERKRTKVEEEMEGRKGTREALFGQNIEPYLGAVFEKGRYESYIRTGQISRETNIILDVTKLRDRKRWLLENVRAAMDGTIPNLEETWKSIVDFWRLDFSEAARRKKLSIEDREKFDEEIRSAMAVCASARAMEASDGVVSTYVGFITHSSPEHPYLDRKDDWAEYLLHGDKGKLSKVFENPLVAFYYQELIKSAGINIFWKKEGEEDIPLKEMSEKEGKERGYKKEWDGNVDRSAFIKGEEVIRGKRLFVFKKTTMAYFLRKGKGGMDRYIQEILLKDEGVDSIGSYEGSEKWAAAKLACDAFLVDKYTRWEYELNKENGQIGEKGGILKPSRSWGGDPLRALLEPSFLPRRIKSMYINKGDSMILDLIDKSFRGVVEASRAKPLEVSMAVDLKAYARWSDALWSFFGGSRAPKVPQWTERVMYEDLPKIAELLDQVYGECGKEGEGKQLMGVMIAKIIKTKALASAMTSARMGYKEGMKILFGEQTEVARPFLKVEQFIWGPERDARKGFLAELASGRTRFIFDNEAKTDLNEAAEILFSCDQTASGSRKAKRLNAAGLVLDVIGIVARGGKGK